MHRARPLLVPLRPLTGIVLVAAALTGSACSSSTDPAPPPPRILEFVVGLDGGTAFAAMTARDATSTTIESAPAFLSAVGVNSARAEAPVEYRRTSQIFEVTFQATNDAGTSTERTRLGIPSDPPPTASFQAPPLLAVGQETEVRFEVADDHGLVGPVQVTWEDQAGTRTETLPVDGSGGTVAVRVTPAELGPLRFVLTAEDRVGPEDLPLDAEVTVPACAADGAAAPRLPGASSGTAPARAFTPELPLGAPLELNRAQAYCFRLPYGEYALAYYDPRLDANTAPGHDWEPFDHHERFTVTVGHATEGFGVAARSAGPGPEPAPGAGSAAAGRAARSSSAWADETEPWQAGDTIAFTDHRISDGVVVDAVLHDYYVVASPVGARISEHIRSNLEPLVDRFHAEVHPRLTAIMLAVPQAANGQLLVVVEEIEGTGTGGNGTALLAALRVGREAFLRSSRGRVYAYGALTRALTESFEGASLAAVETELGRRLVWEQWLQGSLSSHVEYRARGELEGFRFAADLPPAQIGTLGAIFAGFRDLAFGFTATGGYTWYLSGQLSRASGLPWLEAHDTVAAAMWKGRRGCLTDGDCTRLDGLYDVMSRHLGDGWDPGRAALTYILAHAVDDRTDHPELQNVHIDHVPSSPDHTLDSAKPEVAELPVRVGSVGYVELDVHAETTFRAVSSAEGVRWMLVRYR